MATYKVSGALREMLHLPSTLVLSCPGCDSVIYLTAVEIQGNYTGDLNCPFFFKLWRRHCSRTNWELRILISTLFHRGRIFPVSSSSVYRDQKLFCLLPLDVVPLLEKCK